MRTVVSFILVFITLSGFSQKKSAYVSGKVIDENENTLPGVSITILGKQNGIVTSDSGTYRIKVPAEKAFALIFSYSGYRDEQKNFYLSENEEEQLTVKLERKGKTLQAVVINDAKERTETGLIKINPKSTTALPSATGGVEGADKNTCWKQ